MYTSDKKEILFQCPTLFSKKFIETVIRECPDGLVSEDGKIIATEKFITYLENKICGDTMNSFESRVITLLETISNNTSKIQSTTCIPVPPQPKQSVENNIRVDKLFQTKEEPEENIDINMSLVASRLKNLRREK